MNNFRQIRRTVEYHETISTGKKAEGDFYRLDRNNTSSYFDIHQKWRKKIINYFRKLHEEGVIITHVDICGRTSANSLGADKSYCFSFEASKITKIFGGTQQVFFDGDVFNSTDFSNFLKIIKNDNIALVTFEPVAGLQPYNTMKKVEGAELYTQITYQRLIKRLYEVIKIIKPGGMIYLERPFQFDVNFLSDAIMRKPTNQFTISLTLKKIARKMKCKIEIRREISGIYFLLTKT